MELYFETESYHNDSYICSRNTISDVNKNNLELHFKTFNSLVNSSTNVQYHITERIYYAKLVSLHFISYTIALVKLAFHLGIW